MISWNRLTILAFPPGFFMPLKALDLMVDKVLESTLMGDFMTKRSIPSMQGGVDSDPL